MPDAKPTRTRVLLALDNGLSGPIAQKTAKDIISRGRILGFDPNGKDANVVFSDPNFLHLPDGITYNSKDDRVYFSNMGVPSLNDGSICSIKRDGSDPQIVLRQGQVHTPKQIALDTENEKLYISDREGMRVVRCNLNGSELETLIQAGDSNSPAEAADATKWCVGVAVSPGNGLFYWTQKGPSKASQGRIFCAPINSLGEREPVCILDGLPEPIDLDIQPDTNRLFWTDRGELPYGNTFNMLELHSSGTRPLANAPDPTTGLRHEILVQNFDEAIGLVFYPETRRWFVTDIGGTIWTFDVNGKHKTKFYEEKNTAFTGVILA